MADEQTPSGSAASGDSSLQKPKLVGIGASAGGLSALRALFSQLPADTGLTFVVVVHLSPEHESHLADLLQPHCAVPVLQVQATTQMEPDRIYVIPPNANLNSVDTHLRLSELESERPKRATIDHFFRTMAETHDGHAVGVVLTGTGSDGTLGLRFIKERGGVTIAQEPGEAEYDGMPCSAISNGVVDLVLPLDEIIDRVREMLDASYPIEEADEELQAARLLPKVFAHIRVRTGHDFSQYKPATMMRRITRRMQIHRVEDLQAYLDLLRHEEREVMALFDDLLITVTGFFRDAEVFDHLAKEVFPRLFAERGPDQPVRVWSVGCATGEEAYTLAMLLIEEAARHDVAPPIQVFASDLHEHSLARAREGVYPDTITADVQPERLRRFFVQEEGHFRVRREVRDVVVFAQHDLLKDPPFSHLDLIACRNVLIYLQRDVQSDVIGLFHYALKPDGLLLLGSAESVEGDLFRVEDKPGCLYRSRDVPSREPRLPVFPYRLSRVGGADAGGARPQPLSRGALHARLVEQYAPPSVLVDANHNVVHSSAHAGRYLEVPGGEPSTSLFRLLREPLRIETRSALHLARETGRGANSRVVTMKLEGSERQVVVRVRPAGDEELEGYFLVLFDEVAGPDVAPPPGVEIEGQTPSTQAELEAELELTRQRLQTVIEEHEANQEEMRAAHEEMQSANEELRSTMEELETSKEELQSMNEELATVNQENRHRVEELAQLSSDLQNLLTATDIATLFLDRDLRIVRFTPKVTELWSIRPNDKGRPLAELSHRFGHDTLAEEAQRVLHTLQPAEREVHSQDGRWFLLNIRPYRSEDRIEGVVLTLVDITERRQFEQHLRASEERLRRMLNVPGVGVVVFDADGTLTDANDAFLRMTGYDRADVDERRVSRRSLTPPEQIESGERPIEDPGKAGRLGPHSKEYLCRDGSRLFLVSAGAALGNGDVIEYCIDIGDRHRAEAERDRERTLLETVLDTLPVGVVIADAKGRITRANAAAAEVWGLPPRPESWRDHNRFVAWWPETGDRIEADDWALSRALRDGETVRNELVHNRRLNNDERYFLNNAAPLRDEAGDVVGAVAALLDVTERTETQAALERSAAELKREHARLSSVLESLPIGLLIADAEGRIELINDAARRIWGGDAPEAESVEQYGVYRVWHPETDERFGPEQMPMARALRGEVILQETLDFERSDGTRGTQMVSAAPMRLPDGSVAGCVATVQDISERYEHERALRQARDELKQRVAEREGVLEHRVERLRHLLNTRTAAEERERKRMADLLHDDLQQALVAARLQLDVIHRRAQEDDVAQASSRATEMLYLALETSRDLNRRLRPLALHDIGFVAALHGLADETFDRYGLEVDLQAPETELPMLPDEVESAVLRAVRELLFNVVKHAGVPRARVILEGDRAARVLRVCVEDQGGGLPDETLRDPAGAEGTGLLSVREHLAAVGGSLRLESEPGDGTRAVVEVPLATDVAE